MFIGKKDKEVFTALMSKLAEESAEEFNSVMAFGGDMYDRGMIFGAAVLLGSICTGIAIKAFIDDYKEKKKKKKKTEE